jgi:myosin-1
LGQSGCVNVSGVDDAEDFEVLRVCNHSVATITYNTLQSSFSFLNFSKEQQYDVYQILAVVLHLGNLKFKCHRASDIVSVDNEDALNIISNLLGVESKELRQSLLSRTMTVRGASTEILYQLHEVVGVRDALSKTLYLNIT